jgi:hypothetical protein
MDLPYFGQIVSATHVMNIRFKNNIKIDLTETEYYTPLKIQIGGGRRDGTFMGNVRH